MALSDTNGFSVIYVAILKKTALPDSEKLARYYSGLYHVAGRPSLAMRMRIYGSEHTHAHTSVAHAQLVTHFLDRHAQ